MAQKQKIEKKPPESRPGYEAVNTLIEARRKQKVTQKALSEKTGIPQAEISRLENRLRPPTLNLLDRLAEGLDLELIITLKPKTRRGRKPKNKAADGE